MKRALLIVCLAAITKSNLELILPEDLRSQFQYDKMQGNINYTVSTFGNIPYTDKEYVQLMMPSANNLYGCNGLERPKNVNKNDRIVWLVKRGECTYSKKAFIAQQSGSYAVLVYHNQANVDVSNVIPCSDSICKLTR